MSLVNPNKKRLLIVEDDPAVAQTMRDWFTERGYYFATARSFDQARAALDSDHFHVVVVDLNLDNPTQPDNTDGMDVLAYISNQYPEESIRKIIVTANSGSVDLVSQAYERYRIFRFVRKQEGYQQRLILEVEAAIKDLNINFDLVYEFDSRDLIPVIAGALKKDRELRASSVTVEMLTCQIEDLFGKIFRSAKKIYLQNTITQGMTASFVVRVAPTYQAGAGTQVVVKMGRKDKIETEAQNCRDFVEPLLQANAVRLMADAYTRHIGGICYSLTANDIGRGLNEFDRLYIDSTIPTERIMGSIRQLFDINLKNWYHDKRELERRNLIDLYIEAFNLKLPGKNKLERLYQEFEPIFGPGCRAERVEIHFADGSKRTVPNPLRWLEEHDRDCRLRIELNITHGDLTGRNIMADAFFTQQSDAQGESYAYHKFYLIDFFRTRESHTLRDLVILETDLKYRLYLNSHVPPLTEFEQIERTLLYGGAPHLSREGERLFMLVSGLREIGNKLRHTGGDPQESKKEYLISILMATLNVVRLGHIHPERKKHAILSAGLICEQLERLIPRLPDTGAFRPTTVLPPLTPEEFHYKNLAAILAENKLDLFIGRSLPDDHPEWRSPKRLAEQLAGQIPNYRLRHEDSFRYIFSLYRQMYNRAELLSEHVRYFEDAKQYPEFFDKIAALPWRLVFTTNQHTYLERACYAKKRLSVEIVDPQQPVSLQYGTLNIHKLYGSLSTRYRNDPQTLTLTQEEYHQREAEARVKAFQQRIQYDLAHDVTLLMLFPSGRDINVVRRWLSAVEVRIPDVYIVIPDQGNDLEKRSLEESRFKVLMTDVSALLDNIQKAPVSTS